LPYAQKNNIGVIVYSPMYSGLLSGSMTRERIASFAQDDWRGRNANFQEPLLSRNLSMVEALRAIGRAYGRTPGEVAIAWTLSNPAVTAAIVGVRNPRQVPGIVGAGDLQLSSRDLSILENALSENVAA